MRLSIAPYTLNAKSRPGVSAGRDRRGTLIRVEDSRGHHGYADVHPWPELGDLPLEKEIEGMRRGHFSRLSRRSLQFALSDLSERSHRHSSFRHLTIPESHWLVGDVHQLDIEELKKIRDFGFTYLKMKVNGTTEEVEYLNSLPLQLFKLRFDFNARLNPQAFLSWIYQFDHRDAIDFVEDPTPYDAQSWVMMRAEAVCALAVDRLPDGVAADAADVVIYKPAIQTYAPTSGLVCVTSYLDHPVGQMHAALEAAKLAKKQDLPVCGLASHFAYDVNDYSKSIFMEGSRMIPPEGHGIGFDQLLAEEKWETIYEGTL